MQTLFSKTPLTPPPIILQQGKARVHFVLIGGFLGAGKTSATLKFAEFLVRRGMRVGLVANDQGVGLVDQERFKIQGGRFKSKHPAGQAVSSREITGGCFCCRADELVATLREMADGEAGGRGAARSQPKAVDVILAEPVGSCMDLVATVLRPLEQVYAQGYRMAPMSVVVDAQKIQGLRFKISGGAQSGGVGDFSTAVSYIYRKQMEEAAVLVLNKVDLLSKAQRAEVLAGVEAEFPGKKIFEVSTKTGKGLEGWFTWMLEHEHVDTGTLKVDYDLYAEGEALLGWYNAELSVHGVRGEFDGNRLLKQLAKDIQTALEQAGAKVAHFKMSLEGRTGLQPVGLKAGPSSKASLGSKGDSLQACPTLGVVQVVANGMRPVMTEEIGSTLLVGKLLVNLRAESEPRVLAQAVRSAMQSNEARFVWMEQAAFKPGRPVPVHRLDAQGKKNLPKTRSLKKVATV